MKVLLALLVGAGAAAAPLTLLKPKDAATGDQAVLEDIRWLLAADWHRQNAGQVGPECDLSTCVRRHMAEREKERAEANTPEAKKRREEERAKWDAEREARRVKAHAEAFKHPRLADCDFSTRCLDREAAHRDK